MRAGLLCIALAGCGVQSNDPFLLETSDCSLVNNFQIDGVATAWTDCRLYWAGSASNILTVELTQPGSTGSFIAPAASWIRASVYVPGGGLNGDLAAAPLPAGSLPTSVGATQIALDFSITNCGNLGETQTTPVETMADVGDSSVSFSIKLSGSCGGGLRQYTGGFLVSAAAQAGSMTNTDPATVVTTP